MATFPRLGGADGKSGLPSADALLILAASTTTSRLSPRGTIAIGAGLADLGDGYAPTLINFDCAIDMVSAGARPLLTAQT